MLSQARSLREKTASWEESQETVLSSRYHKDLKGLTAETTVKCKKKDELVSPGVRVPFLSVCCEITCSLRPSGKGAHLGGNKETGA